MGMKDTIKTSVVYDQNGNPIQVDSERLARAIKPVGNENSVANQIANDAAPDHQMVYMTRPHEPVMPPISDEVRARHDESVKLFPGLNLSEGEYVISFVKRHPIGLLQIWAVVAVAILALIGGIFITMNGGEAVNQMIAPESSPWLAMIFLALIVMVFLGGIAATVIYEGNRFFLTNESVTQHIQMSLFSKKEQTISLLNIEDASFRQSGLLQTFLNYGSLRLSTQGDETTYRFNYVADPGRQVALLNNAIEAFKNGRPVDQGDL